MAAQVNMFQSAPPAEARGDEETCGPVLEHKLGFNPLPRPKQGEIHKPRKYQRRIIRFNPLPRPKQGEIEQKESDAEASMNISFNPLPRPKQGEITSWTKSFNPLPRPKQGEICKENNQDKTSSFNPLPRPKQGEITA